MPEVYSAFGDQARTSECLSFPYEISPCPAIYDFYAALDVDGIPIMLALLIAYVATYIADGHRFGRSIKPNKKTTKSTSISTVDNQGLLE